MSFYVNSHLWCIKKNMMYVNSVVLEVRSTSYPGEICLTLIEKLRKYMRKLVLFRLNSRLNVVSLCWCSEACYELLICTLVTSTRPNAAHYMIYFFLSLKRIYSRHDVTLTLGTKFDNITPGWQQVQLLTKVINIYE